MGQTDMAIAAAKPIYPVGQQDFDLLITVEELSDLGVEFLARQLSGRCRRQLVESRSKLAHLSLPIPSTDKPPVTENGSPIRIETCSQRIRRSPAALCQSGS